MKARALFMLVLIPCLLAQQQNPTPTSSLTGHAAVDQEPNSENDVEMEGWLNENGKTIERLVGLGVERSIAESITSPVIGGEPAFVKWQTARTGLHERFALLFFPCHVFQNTAYLYTLARQDKSWYVTDHIELDCHYDDSVSFEAASIHDPKRDEVLVHHACAGRGTGYLEQHFSVFAVFDGKLKEELETEEVLHSYPTAVERPRDLDQNSTFTVIPVVGSRSRAIEETRSSVLNGKLTVQRRIFHWDAAKEKYVPSPFTPVEAPPN